MWQQTHAGYQNESGKCNSVEKAKNEQEGEHKARSERGSVLLCYQIWRLMIELIYLPLA